MNIFFEKLTHIISAEQVTQGEELSRHTTFRIGGAADFYVEPSSHQELKNLVALCRKEAMPYFLLGNGSNLLVGDRGYRGVVISLAGKPWTDVTIREGHVYAGAGALLSVTAKQALLASLTGFEFAAGIPGTIGGAVVMNAGAYGSEMKRVLTVVTVLTPEGEIKCLPVSELELGYRTSCILRENYVVLQAELLLMPGEEAGIRSIMEDLARQRRSKQPLEYPSAGSTFKRPEGHFAGKLIQDAGLRGFRVGGAQVSEKHCGFVINRDHATAADVLHLCEEVQKRVKEEFNVTLELEVKRLGEF